MRPADHAENTEVQSADRHRERAIYVVEGTLLHQPTDIIVNSWHRNIVPPWLPFLTFGVSHTIKHAAGREAFQELAEQGPLPLGGAVLTGPGRLRKKGIIHVAAVNLLGRASETSVRISAESAMEIVNRLGFRSVAFPVLGVGETGGMPELRAYEILTDALMKIPSFAEVRIVRARSAKNQRNH